MIAKTNKKKTAKSKKVKKTETKQQPEEEDILRAIDAISDEESDEDAGQVIDDDGQDWDEEAMALRKMISDGKFNDLLKRHDQETGNEYEEDVAEDELESEAIDEEDVQGEDDEEEEDEEEEDEKESKDSDSESSDDEEQQKQDTKTKALAAAVQSSNRNLPFAESFTVVPPTPLPFGSSGGAAKSIAVCVDEEDTTVDVHDDLKREVAFYDTALEAVHLARGECERVGIPFTRPDDFFAEMMKTDGECQFSLS